MQLYSQLACAAGFFRTKLWPPKFVFCKNVTKSTFVLRLVVWSLILYSYSFLKPTGVFQSVISLHFASQSLNNRFKAQCEHLHILSTISPNSMSRPTGICAFADSWILIPHCHCDVEFFWGSGACTSISLSGKVPPHCWRISALSRWSAN